MSSWLATRALPLVAFALACSSSAHAADVSVIWDAPVSGVPAGYHLFYGPSSGSMAFALHAPGQQTTATLRGLDPGRTYYVRVHAHDAQGRLSEASNEIVIGVATDAPVTAAAPASAPAGTTTGDVSYLRTVDTRRFPMLQREADVASRLAVANPAATAVAVTFLGTAEDGGRVIRTVSVPALSQRVVDATDLMPDRYGRLDVAVLASAPIAVERREVWGTPVRGGVGDAGGTGARTTWLFAEGSTRAPLRTVFRVHNPGATDADLSFLYLRASGAAVTRVHVVPAHGYETIDMSLEGVELLNGDAGVQITSTNGVPVYVERTVSLVDTSGQVRGGHGATGLDGVQAGWTFVDGATGPYFDLHLALVNVAAVTAQLAVDIRRADGLVVSRSLIVPAKRRVTLLIDTLDSRLADAVVSVTTRSLNGVPHAAEQVQWWGGAGAAAWTDGHVAGPLATPASRWVMADGQSGGAPVHQTFALIRNVGTTDEQVRVRVLGATGVIGTQTVTIPAGARVSLDPATFATPSLVGSYGLLVEAVDGDAALLAQHVTYWGVGTAAWGGGVGTPATALR